MRFVMTGKQIHMLQTAKRGALMALLAAACFSLTSCGSVNSLLNSILRLPGQICRAILP